MTRYNSYAKQLDEAFKAARSAYSTAHSKLEDLREKTRNAQNPAEKAHLSIELAAEQENFRNEDRRIWKEFDSKCAELKAALAEDVRKSSAATPEEVDSVALELMKSGVMTANDFTSFAEKYDGNSTMMKLIGHYAKEAVETAPNRQDAMTLRILSNDCATGTGKILKQWNALETAANYCSGRGAARGRKTTPSLTLSMGTRWEELSADMVENF